MGRTTLNITGDASCAIIVSHLQQAHAKRRAKKAKAEEVAYADR
jgi:Na+/H+-dicarboxylate symporter